MIVDPGFLTHWKTVGLVRKFGEAAPLMLLRLWGHCQTRKAWEFELTTEDLAFLCQHDGDPKELEDVLVRLRFIERDGNLIRLPEWPVVNASLLGSWKNGALGGRPKKPGGNPRDTHGQPVGNPPRTDKRREEEIGEEEKETPAGDGGGLLSPPPASAIETKAQKAERARARLRQITLEAVEAYNGKLTKKAGGLLARVKLPDSDERLANVKRALAVAGSICEKEFGSQTITPKFWENYFEACLQDEHKSGRLSTAEGRGWMPDFEYLTRPDVVQKVYEKATDDDSDD